MQYQIFSLLFALASIVLLSACCKKCDSGKKSSAKSSCMSKRSCGTKKECCSSCHMSKGACVCPSAMDDEGDDLDAE